MNIKQLTLYHYPATRSARAKWALHETVGDDFKVVNLDLYGGEQYTEGFIAKNPGHSVPTLEVEFLSGEKYNMTESVAIVQWLADAFPRKELAPKPELSLERADYLRIMSFVGATVDMALWQVRTHQHLLPKAEVDDLSLQRYRNKFTMEIEPFLSGRLKENNFICGDGFSAADIVVCHAITWARAYGFCKSDEFSAYVSRLAKRPAFAKTFADAAAFNPELPDRELNINFSG